MPYSDINVTVKECSDPKDRLDAVKRFLEEYGFARKNLRMSQYCREYFDAEEDSLDESCGDEVLLRAKMYEVKSFILGMPSSNERLFLYYHYIRGETVERCAELLDISRRSGFRLKKRALEKASRLF